MMDLVAFDYLQPAELEWSGHGYFDMAQQHSGLQDNGYEAARAQCLAMSRDVIDAAIQKDKLDAIVVGTGGLPGLIDPIGGDALTPDPNAPTLPAIAGYPHITVPAGFYHSLPVGVVPRRRVHGGHAARLRIRVRASDEGAATAEL